jgi:arginine decarboxylase
MAQSQFVPSRIALVKGVGRHREKLASFEEALRKAGIAHLNLVRVSSIFPPQCRIVPSKNIQDLRAGEVTYVVMSESATDEAHRLIAASVGVAVPKNPENYGYLSEHHSFGQTDEEAGVYAEDLAAQMLATIIGVEFNADSSWDERREIWRISDLIVRTTNITQSAVGKAGQWTTVLSAAVLLP